MNCVYNFFIICFDNQLAICYKAIVKIRRKMTQNRLETNNKTIEELVKQKILKEGYDLVCIIKDGSIIKEISASVESIEKTDKGLFLKTSNNEVFSQSAIIYT